MRIIYFFLSQLEKCFIGKKREKSLLPEEKEGPFWWTRFWQSRGDREKSFLSNAIQRKACYEVCRKHNKPVIVMEPVKGGNLVNLPKEAKVVYDK